jgi:hypothetical protein
MDKYGVVVDDDFSKHASAGNLRCPKCGGKVTTKGSLPYCENCGTAPWEKAPADKDKR